MHGGGGEGTGHKATHHLWVRCVGDQSKLRVQEPLHHLPLVLQEEDVGRIRVA